MRPESEGILVLRRLTSLEDHPFGIRAPANPPSAGLDHADILVRYRGIQGVTWPDVELADFTVDRCLVDVFKKDRVQAYFDCIAPFYGSDMLYCQIYNEVPLMVSLARDLRFLGYDYGHLTPDYQGGCGSFSVLFNEVVYGAHEQLRLYSKHLNRNLLAPSLDLLRDLHSERSNLLKRGEPGIETAYLDEPSQTIAIFNFKEG